MVYDILRKKKWWPEEEDGKVPSSSTAIVAGVGIPAGISSLPFASCLNLRRSLETRRVNSLLKAVIGPNGNLTVEKCLDWLPLLRLAENCEDKNVEVTVTPFADAVVLRSCKFIPTGIELKAWFSNELITLLEIPFLTPSHIISHEIYKCFDCGTVFSQPNPLKIHLAFACRIRHPSNGSSSGRTDSTKSLAGTEAAGSRHPTDDLARGRRVVTKEPKTHICMFCGKLYTRKYGLKIHLRTHTGHKPLQCRFCGRPFSDPSNLNKHIRLHAHHSSHLAGNPHKCHECGKVMIRRRDLDRHLKTRHS